MPAPSTTSRPASALTAAARHRTVRADPFSTWSPANHLSQKKRLAVSDAFSNQPNRSAGNHCFQNIAANQTPVRDCRFSGEVCEDGPEGDGPATLVRMEGQGKLSRYRWRSSGLHSSQDGSGIVAGRRDRHVVHERNPHEHLISLRSGCCVAQMTSRKFRAGRGRATVGTTAASRTTGSTRRRPSASSKPTTQPSPSSCANLLRPTFLSILPPFPLSNLDHNQECCPRSDPET